MSKLGKYKKKLAGNNRDNSLISQKFEVPKTTHLIDCPILTAQIRLPRNPFRTLGFGANIDKKFINDKCNDVSESVKLSMTEDIIKSPDFLLKIVSRLGSCTKEWMESIIYSNEEFNQKVLRLNRYRLENNLEPITWNNVGMLLHNNEIELEEYVKYIEYLYAYLSKLCIDQSKISENILRYEEMINMSEESIIEMIQEDLEGANDSFVWFADFLVEKFRSCYLETPSFVIQIGEEVPVVEKYGNSVEEPQSIIDIIDAKGFNAKNEISIFYRDYAIIKDNSPKEILISGHILRKGVCETEEDSFAVSHKILENIELLSLDNLNIIYKECACGQMLIYIMNYHLKFLQEDIGKTSPRIIKEENKQKITSMFGDTENKSNNMQSEKNLELISNKNSEVSMDNILKININLANQKELLISNDKLKLPKARSLEEMQDRNYYKERWIRKPYWRRLKNGELHYFEMQICKRNPDLIKGKENLLNPEIKLDI